MKNDNQSSDSCKFCDETQNLEKHHLVPRRFGGFDKEDNLVQVCPNCHSKLEDLYDKRFYNELGVKKRKKSGDRGWYLVTCRVCDRRSIDFKPTNTGSLQCQTCDSNSVFIEYRINEEFAEVVDLENFTDDSGKDYYIWVAYSEEYTGELRQFTYPRGQEAVSYDSKETAYDRAVKFLMKDWCKDAAVFSFKHLTDRSDEDSLVEELVVSDLLEVDGPELTRAEDKVMDLIRSSEENVVSKEKLLEKSSMREYKLDNVLEGLKNQGHVLEEENGFVAVIK